MGDFLSLVTGVIDANGNRLDTPDANGNYPCILLQVGTGTVASVSKNGTNTIVRLDVGAGAVPVSRQLLPGAGILASGLGDLSADRTINVGANGDGSIVVNAHDVQLKPAFSALLSGATAAATPNTLAERDGTGGIAFASITSTVNALGASTSTVDTLQNTTASTVPTPAQWSGARAWLGTAWDTGAVASRVAGWRAWAKTISGNPGTSELRIESVYNGAAAPCAAFTTTGQYSGGLLFDAAFGGAGQAFAPNATIGYAASTGDLQARGIGMAAQDSTNAGAGATGGPVGFVTGAGKDAAHAGGMLFILGGLSGASRFLFGPGSLDGNSNPSGMNLTLGQMSFSETVLNPRVQHSGVNNADGQRFLFTAQAVHDGGGGGDFKGGWIMLRGGSRLNNGQNGSIVMANGAEHFIAEAADLSVTGGQRIVFGVAFGSAMVPASIGPGDGMIALAEATTVPSGAGAVRIYVDPADHKAKICDQAGTIHALW